MTASAGDVGVPVDPIRPVEPKLVRVDFDGDGEAEVVRLVPSELVGNIFVYPVDHDGDGDIDVVTLIYPASWTITGSAVVDTDGLWGDELNLSISAPGYPPGWAQPIEVDGDPGTDIWVHF
ncbi:MAG TPA: hypothetical protein PKC43_10925 [Phycisphaerales bacterium]|nr:hypothetical protein [Phycisphaerales bacterium]HMP37946.1 hypothetical protein [Phycisphaerales bacterium]